MNDRHATVDVNCETCGKTFSARAERVIQGLGRFCSKKCFDIEQRKRAEKLWGRKDLAKCYKVGNKYCARWYDENGKTKSSTYARWWWEMNVGEIQKGMIVLHIDNNPLNIDPFNFKLGVKSDALVAGNKSRKSNRKKWSEYLNKQSKRMKGKWENGDFDHIKGSGNYKWKGGSHFDEYPKDFYEIRDFIRSRDGYTCQVCEKEVNNRSGQVHHIDGNKQNSDQDNLVLLCISCHSKVHSKLHKSPEIMALRSELEWSK